MKKLIFAVIAGAAAMGAAQAQETYPKTYVGAGIASVDHQFSVQGATNTDTDGWKASGKLFAGYEINQNWGAEVGYTDFRSADARYTLNGVNGNAETKGHSFYLAAKASVPINEQFGAYAKFGAAYNKASLSSTTPGLSYDDSRATPYGALGLQYKLNQNVSLVAEYERYGDKRDFGAKPDVVTVGARYSF
jgi:opacity protein-like surface antigen